MPKLPTERQQEDATLLASCLAGDEDAWAVLIERYSRLVYSIALKSGLPEDDAADVVQNVFTTVLRRLESLQQADRFSAWLITISHRESWRARRAQRDQPLADSNDPVDPGQPADMLVADWEQATIVHQALRLMDSRCRALIDMLFLREPRPDYETISAELGIAIGSIGPIRGRCLKRLRGKLDDLGVVGSDA